MADLNERSILNQEIYSLKQVTLNVKLKVN